MNEIPLNLPLRAADAAELGRLIFEHAEPMPLTAEMRNRLAARAAVLRFESVTPYFGSLVRDAVHPSTYYLAVDARPAAGAAVDRLRFAVCGCSHYEVGHFTAFGRFRATINATMARRSQLMRLQCPQGNQNLPARFHR